jgi:2-polyprenyl-3-methyl-5-hydroxy-6-metoxy-1,4-benzoquinol methylase
MSYQQYFSTPRPEMLKFIPENSTKFLDIGCGDGSFAASLMKKENEVWGVEIDQQRADIARPKINHLITGDFIQNIDQIPSKYFDCIFYNDVLEHLLDPCYVLKKTKPLLKPDGVVISSIPNFRYVGNLQEILIQGEFRYKEGGILDKTHLRFFTQKSILRLFNEAGYDVVSIEGIRPTNSWKLKLFSFLTFKKFSDIRFVQFATVAKQSKYEK